MKKSDEPIERTGGAYEADPKTGKLKRVEEATRMPEPPSTDVPAQPPENQPAVPPAAEDEGKH